MIKRYLPYIAIGSAFLLTLCIAALFYISVPLVPVAGFTGEAYAVTLDDLYSSAATGKPYDFVVLKSWQKAIKRLLGVQYAPGTIFIAEDKLASVLQENRQAVALIPWYMVGPQYRTLRYEDTYFWDGVNKDYELTVRRLRFFTGVRKYTAGKITTLTVGGTVVLSRGIGNIIDLTNNLNYPWQEIAPLMRKSDLAIVNFKSPVVYNFSKPENKMLLYGKALYANGLAYSGIDIVSLAGNHIGDAGVQGIIDTQKVLQALKINYTGVGETPEQALKPVIKKVRGLSVGFIAVNSVGQQYHTDLLHPDKKIYVATLQETAIRSALAELRQKVDVIIVMPNWGDEYVSIPNPTQQRWARLFVDWGADLVVGDQAHWVQSAEFYQGKFISYGLGNLIFDQSWSQNTREGIIERFMYYKKHLVAIDVIPVCLNDSWFTSIAQRENIHSILDKLRAK